MQRLRVKVMQLSLPGGKGAYANRSPNRELRIGNYINVTVDPLARWVSPLGRMGGYWVTLLAEFY